MPFISSGDKYLLLLNLPISPTTALSLKRLYPTLQHTAQGAGVSDQLFELLREAGGGGIVGVV